MASQQAQNDIRIVPFSAEWLEAYVDLAIADDALDPLYTGHPSRDEVRRRTAARLDRTAGMLGVNRIALVGESLVASARAIVIPSCGPSEGPTATLSLMVRDSHRGRGIGGRLLETVLGELSARGMEWTELGIQDAWEGWVRFLRKKGFVPVERFADVRLDPDMPLSLPGRLPGIRIRAIRLPEERDAVLRIYNEERGRDLPRECAILAGQPAWWEVGPGSEGFDPAGFLVAVDDDRGHLVGYASSVLCVNGERWGRIDYLDVVRDRLETDLPQTLLLSVLGWLRAHGARPIRSRVHFGYRNEAAVFEGVGFRIESPATVWRRRTSDH